MLAITACDGINWCMKHVTKSRFYRSEVRVSIGVRNLPQLAQAKAFSQLWELNVFAPDKGLENNNGIATIDDYTICWKIEHTQHNPRFVKQNITRTLHIYLPSEEGDIF